MKTVVEASQLGLAPGQWPPALQYDNRTWVLHRRVHSTPAAGMELLAVIYVPARTEAEKHTQHELHVIND